MVNFETLVTVPNINGDVDLTYKWYSPPPPPAHALKQRQQQKTKTKTKNKQNKNNKKQINSQQHTVVADLFKKVGVIKKTTTKKTTQPSFHLHTLDWKHWHACMHSKSIGCPKTISPSATIFCSADIAGLCLTQILSLEVKKTGSIIDFFFILPKEQKQKQNKKEEKKRSKKTKEKWRSWKQAKVLI